MEQTGENKSVGLAFNLFKNMQQDNLEYTYRGSFNTATTDNILSLAESNLKDTKEKVKIRKRVYFIMVEGLQNITRHQETLSESINEPGLFVIQRKKESYYITTGNLIKQENIEHLQGLLDKINSLNAAELKEYYREILNTRNVSAKGGAGLGLIEIARKSGKQLIYDFEPYSDQFSFFYLHTEIPFDEDFVNTESSNNIMINIKNLHKMLNEYNILLNFTGIFNQENLINLLTIIERQMKGTVIMLRKVYKIMLEMLQNILKYADDYTFNDVSGHYGIFFISETEKSFAINTGNYILNEKVDELKTKIDTINHLEYEALYEHYTNLLKEFKKDDTQRSGLGLIDMRMNSKQPFVYEFFPVDENYSFYSLQIFIQKKTQLVKTLAIKSTLDTPEVILDIEKSVFKFTGRSYPEDPYIFYEPIIKWFEDYAKNPNSFAVVEFRLEYYNTTSLRIFTKILYMLEKISERSNIKIKWFYRKEDEDAMETGLRFSKLIELEFNMIEMEDDFSDIDETLYLKKK